MNMNIRSGWHVDGTRTPSRWKRGGLLTRIWERYVTEALPLRATDGSMELSTSAELRGCWDLCGSSGTEWHDGP